MDPEIQEMVINLRACSVATRRSIQLFETHSGAYRDWVSCVARQAAAELALVNYLTSNTSILSQYAVAVDLQKSLQVMLNY